METIVEIDKIASVTSYYKMNYLIHGNHTLFLCLNN